VAREDPQMKLRLPQEMKDHITKAAQDNGRSVNAEIVARLQISVEADKMQWSHENLRMDVLKTLEEATKESQYQARVMKWMVEQQQAANRLLEHIASTDGHLKPDFMEALRAMLARRGSEEIDFPKHPDDE
jgi:hypothetical protein